MSRVFVVVGGLSAAVAFWTAYRYSNGHMLLSIAMAVSVVGLFSQIGRVIRLRKEERSSGLSREEAALQFAGGPDGIMLKAAAARRLGYLCLALPVGAAAVLVPHGAGSALTVGVLVGILFFPFAGLAFWLARKNERVAAEALARGGDKAS
jgi:Zn-dependent protease with chaperone function